MKQCQKGRIHCSLYAENWSQGLLLPFVHFVLMDYIILSCFYL